MDKFDRPFTVQIDRIVEEIIPAFLKGKQEDLVKMKSALDNGDYTSVEQIAHKIKGSSGSYGFNQLSELGKELEFACKESDKEKVPELIEQIGCYLKFVNIEYIDDME